MKSATVYYATLFAMIVTALVGSAFGASAIITSSFVAGLSFTLGWNASLIMKAREAGQKLAVKRWAIQYSIWSAVALALTIWLS